LGAGLWAPFSNFHFGGAETGSIADRDRFAEGPSIISWASRRPRRCAGTSRASRPARRRASRRFDCRQRPVRRAPLGDWSALTPLRSTSGHLFVEKFKPSPPLVLTPRHLARRNVESGEERLCHAGYSRASTVPGLRRRGRSARDRSPRAKPARCFAVLGSNPPKACS
jgi:hypothetical protein